MADKVVKVCLYIGLLYQYLGGAQAIICLKCDNVNRLALCDHFTRCQENQACFFEKSIDFAVSTMEKLAYTYTAGCRDLQMCNLVHCAEEITTSAPKVKRDGVVCTECCYSDKCNLNGCEVSFRSANESDQQPPFCFDCSYLEENDTCVTFTQCNAHHICKEEKVFERRQGHPNDQIPYLKLGCEQNQKCTILATLGADINTKCCDKDFCNSDPRSQHSESENVAEMKECPTGLVKPTTPTTTTSTKASTTPTSPPPPPTTTTKATTTPTPTPTTTTTTPKPPTTTTSPTTTTTTPTKTTSTTTTTAPTTTTTAPTTTAPTTTTTTTTTTAATTTAATTTTTTTTTTIAPTTTAPTTIASTTTTPTTTPTTTTTTQRPPRTIPPNPTRCFVCTEDLQDYCDQYYVATTCDPPNNYCINYISNKADGSKSVNRTCGNFQTCYKDWYEGSSDKDQCQNFRGDNVETSNFECTYCCIKDNCNEQLHPSTDTLYTDN